MPARRDWSGGRSRADYVVLSKIIISLDLLVLLNPCLPACIWQAAGKKLKEHNI
jgi:hypothetical protein